jgi:F0F1-type ATP synthase membrane subunit a
VKTQFLALKLNAADALFHPITRALSVVAMVVSFVFPVNGLGIDLCVFHATTGWPCPGCGLTRGISAFSQLQIHRALELHPFVLVLWPTFAFLAVVSLFPKAWRQRIETQVRESKTVSVIFNLTLGAFVAFGVLRLLFYALRGERF